MNLEALERVDARIPIYGWDSKSIVLLRQALGETQIEFAERIGFHRRTLQHWEIGTYIPSVSTISILWNVLQKELKHAKDSLAETN